MRDLVVVGAGIVKFSNVKFLDNDTTMIIYLIQHVSDKGKKSHFQLIEYAEMKHDPLPKDTEIEFTGILRENIYKDKDGEFKSTGLEIIADNIISMEVFK